MSERQWYTTKMLVEVTVTHQFDPERGIGIVTGRLTGCDISAVKNVRVVSAESNYALHAPPLDEMVPVKL